jgi:hypothetical protein
MHGMKFEIKNVFVSDGFMTNGTDFSPPNSVLYYLGSMATNDARCKREIKSGLP